MLAYLFLPTTTVLLSLTNPFLFCEQIIYATDFPWHFYVSFLMVILVFAFVLVSCGKPTFEEAAKTLQDEITGYGATYEIKEINLKQTLLIYVSVNKNDYDVASVAATLCVNDIYDEYSARDAELLGHLEDCCITAVGIANGKVVHTKNLFQN